MTEHRRTCEQSPFLKLERPRKRRNTGNAWANWVDRHADWCSKNGIDEWWVGTLPTEEEQTLFPTLKRLKPRECDILKLKHKARSGNLMFVYRPLGAARVGVMSARRNGKQRQHCMPPLPLPLPIHPLMPSVVQVTFPELEARLLCTSDSMERASACNADAGDAGLCLTCGNEFYHTGKCRKLLGVEQLFMQGIHFGSVLPDVATHISNSYPDKVLGRLAGNAFHAWCCAVAFISTIRALAEATPPPPLLGAARPAHCPGPARTLRVEGTMLRWTSMHWSGVSHANIR